jgi:hypothetical protein
MPIDQANVNPTAITLGVIVALVIIGLGWFHGNLGRAALIGPLVGVALWGVAHASALLHRRIGM